MLGNTRLGVAAILVIAALAQTALPCTAFLIVGNGKVLMGNNEDFWDYRTLMWFVPRSEGRHGAVYLGYTNRFPQGGMNEAGLAFDGFATKTNPLRKQKGKPTFQGNLIVEAMETCSTVAEVVEMFERYDLSLLQNAMLMFADKSGDSVIIEGDEIVRKKGDFQVVTNFYPSQQENDLAMCGRFARATEILEKRKRVSLELCCDALAVAAQTGPTAATQYSNIFDLKRGRIHLYHFHDFQDAKVFDLAVELERGAREYEIPKLFEPDARFEAFVAARERTIEERIEKQLLANPDPSKLDECAGRYRLARAGAGDIELTVKRDGTRLVISIEGQPKQPFFPESNSMFFHIDLDGEQKIRFERGADGRITALVHHSILGHESRAIRLED